MTENGRSAVRTFPESLRDLERALAETQYAATVAAPFRKAAAVEYLRALEAVRNQLDDLAAFIKRQAR